MSKHIAPHIKAVIFDHDDTLVGTIKPKWAQHKHVAKTYYGKDLKDAEIIKHWGKPLNDLVCLLYGTDNVVEAIANNTAHHTAYPKELFAATIPTLKQIKSLGLLIGIVTATTRFSFEHDLQEHKVPKGLLDYTQTADDTTFHKPDPLVFEPATAWLASKNIQPNEVLYVGDGLHDMKAALGAGFSFLGVQTELVSTDDFYAAGAKSIPSIANLLEIN